MGSTAVVVGVGLAVALAALLVLGVARAAHGHRADVPA